MQDPSTSVKPEDLVVLTEDGNVAIFMNFEDASDFRDEHSIDGQCVELPTYF